jgi:hypothetical protein
MQFKRICAPGIRRTSNPAGPKLQAIELRAARRALSAGPSWGRGAAATIVAAVAVSITLAARTGLLTSPLAAAVGALVAVAGFGVAGWLCRPGDFNRWLAFDPRHGQGSCQWLIWRGVMLGRPCAACLSRMSGRERRYWLRPQVTVAVGLAPPTAPISDRLALPSADSGAVSVETFLFLVLSSFLVVAATSAWLSPAARIRSAAWPLLLASLVIASVSLHAHRRRPPGTGFQTPPEPTLCESCHRVRGSVRVLFPDGVAFTVCAACLAGGCFGIAAQADDLPAVQSRAARGVSR